MAINWLFDGNWTVKLKRISTNKSLWAFLLVYFSIAFSFFYSENIVRAITELRIWLPLFIIPIIISTSDPLNKKELKLILILFCTSLLVSTLIGLNLYLRDFSDLGQNVRYLSPYILHIRLALMIDLGVFAIVYMVLQRGFFNSIVIKIILIFILIWFIIFLLILQSLTGILVLFATSIVLLTRWSLLRKNSIFKFFFIVAISLSVILAFAYLAHTIDKYFTRQYVNFKNLPEFTVNGNRYVHDTSNQQYENGNLVWINICYPELKRYWERESKLPFNGKDKTGQQIDLTVIRYLASKGLSKDSIGLSKLDSIDFRLIENGVSSVIYREHKAGIYPRLYQALWEIDSYRTRNLTSGSSVVQRYIYIKTSLSIIKKNILWGVGVGDGRDSLFEHYKTFESSLKPTNWKTSHNQYLNVWLASGIIGLSIFLFGLLYPFFNKRMYKYFLPCGFMLILLLSMFSIETLELHVGASFVALFYSVFFFGYDFKENEVHDL